VENIRRRSQEEVSKARKFSLESFAESLIPVRDSLEAALAHEQLVTASINNIYQVAVDARDYRTMEFLNWFIKEQGEEEKSASDLIRKYELFGNDPKSLYLLDQELGARTYVAPTLVLD